MMTIRDVCFECNSRIPFENWRSFRLHRHVVCHIMGRMKIMAAFAVLALSSYSLFAGEAEMNRLLADWQQKMNDWQNAVMSAPSPEAKAAIPSPNAADMAPSLWKSISSQIGQRRETVVRGKGKKRREEIISVPAYEFDQPWALPGIMWFLQNPESLSAAFDEEQQNQVDFYVEAIAKSLSRVHFSNPEIRHICPLLAQNSGVREYELMQKIYNRNQDSATRATAALSLSLMLNNPMISGVEGSHAMIRGKRIYYLKQALLLGDPNVPFGHSTLGEVAKEQTYRLRYLSEGCIPPQIRLRTVEGRTVSCPQQGKMNLLLFWSPEEQSGAAMVARLDKLKSKYPELVVTPVVPFQTPETLQQLLQTVPGMEQSLVDDADGSAGQAYRISSIPTAVLISHRSTLLYMGDLGVQLQTALDSAMPPQQTSRSKVSITPVEENPPVMQPGSQPKSPEDAPAQDATPPALREMPRF